MKLKLCRPVPVLLACLIATAQGAALQDKGPSATLDVPRQASASTVPVRVTLHNPSGTDLVVELPRAGRQSCAAAPHLRVLRVGSREVVYPTGDEALAVLCAADMFSATVAARSRRTFERGVELPPGEYVVEAWIPGFGGRAPVSAGYARVTVK